MEATSTRVVAPRPAAKRLSFCSAILIAAMMVASCATAPKTSAPANAPDAAQGGKPEAMGPHDVYGPPVPEMYGPDRVGLRPVILVLGPGLARGFAYVGALRALHEAKVPIGAILGTEMGSLIGALYAMKGSINSLEWALFKLKDDAFVEKRGFLTQLLTKPGDGQKLSRELDRVFGKRDLTDAKIPLRILIQSPDAPGSKLLEKGPTGTAVRASIAVPGLFSPVEWEGHEASSPAAAHPFLVSEARNLGIGPVIVVDVLDGASGESEKNPTIEQQMAQATAAGAADLKDADLVIKVDMKGIGYLDFQKRSEAAFRGKTAVAAQIPAIRHLVGLPEGSAQP